VITVTDIQLRQAPIPYEENPMRSSVEYWQ